MTTGPAAEPGAGPNVAEAPTPVAAPIAKQADRRAAGRPCKNIKPEDQAMKTMDDLFYALLQDVYYAEKQLVKVLPKLAKKSSDPDLQKAFTDHLAETKGHVERLERVFEMINKKARGKTCDAILGIVAEGEEVMQEAKDAEIRNAGILAAAQAAEHYEIARYGTLCAWANQLGKPQIARLLHQTLDEEKKTDALLSAIAERSVNRQALSA